MAEWETKLIRSLPDELKGRLPSIEEVESELEKDSLREEGLCG